MNPDDTKKRHGWLGSTMPFPRVIPHSDGVGTVESVGEGVDHARVLPLERTAEAHDRVDAGSRERVLVTIPD